MRIRPFDDSDEQAVIALWKSDLADSAPHNDPATAIRNKLKADRHLFLVAEIEGVVAGTAMGGYDGHRGWIYAVVVARPYRRKGVGTALLRRIEELLAGMGCFKVNLQIRSANAEVQAFYETLGYEVEQRISMGKRLY